MREFCQFVCCLQVSTFLPQEIIRTFLRGCQDCPHFHNCPNGVNCQHCLHRSATSQWQNVHIAPRETHINSPQKVHIAYTSLPQNVQMVPRSLAQVHRMYTLPPQVCHHIMYTLPPTTLAHVLHRMCTLPPQACLMFATGCWHVCHKSHHRMYTLPQKSASSLPQNVHSAPTSPAQVQHRMFTLPPQVCYKPDAHRVYTLYPTSPAQGPRRMHSFPKAKPREQLDISLLCLLQGVYYIIILWLCSVYNT